MPGLPTGTFRFGRASLAFFVAGALSFPLLYGLAIAVSPARTSDGHPVMPIGQTVFAIVFAPVLGAITGYLFGRDG